MNLPPVLPAVATESTYMLSVSIRVGRGTISLKSDQLKDQTLSDALRANGVKSKDTLPVFEAELTPEQGEWVRQKLGWTKAKAPSNFSLLTAGTALSTLLDRLQRKYMICGVSRRWWFVAASDMPDVDAGFEEMETMRENLLSVLHELYEPAKVLFESRLQNVLTAANRADDFNSYAGEFPTWTEIEREFRIEVDGRIPVPSLLEIAKQSPEMQRWMGDVRKQLTEELPRLIDEILDLSTGVIRYTEKNAVNQTEQRTKMMGQNHERLMTLRKMYLAIAYPESPAASDIVTGLIDRCDTLKFWDGNSEKTDSGLLNLRKWLMQSDNTLLIGRGDGCKALSEWVQGRNAQDEFKSIKNEIQALQNAELTGKELSPKLFELQQRADSSLLKTQMQSQHIAELIDGLRQGAIAPATELAINHDVVEAGF